MAPKKLRYLEFNCLQWADRMMFEDEIEVFKAIIVDKEEHITALEISASRDKSGDEEKIQNLERVVSGKEQEVKTLLVKIDDDEKEIGALKIRNKNYRQKLQTLNTIIETQRKEIDDVKKEAVEIEEENKKLQALNIKIEKDKMECTKELNVFKFIQENQKKEIEVLKIQATIDTEKHKETVHNMKKVIEKDKIEVEAFRSKVEEEKKKVKDLADRHKLFVDRLSDKIECPVCLEVPRAGPVPVCPNGHFVCKKCKSALCPTCRVAMGNGKSLLAVTVVENIDHRCKFDDCEEYSAVDKLDDHAKVCGHRTVCCPNGKCSKNVALSKLLDHLSKTICSNDKAPAVNATPSLVVMHAFVLTPEENNNSNNFCYRPKLYSFDDVAFCIFPAKDTGHFYFSFVMFSSDAVCSKYKIEMNVHGKDSPQVLDSEVGFKFYGKPSSIDGDYNEAKHLGLTVNGKAMEQILKNGNGFYISFSIRKR